MSLPGQCVLSVTTLQLKVTLPKLRLANYNALPVQFTPQVTKADGSAECNATTYADSIVYSASDNAAKILPIAENICTAGNPIALREKTTGFVEAFVDTLTSAWTQCVATGGDPNYDGGCALATAYAGSTSCACSLFLFSFFLVLMHSESPCSWDCSVSTV